MEESDTAVGIKLECSKCTLALPRDAFNKTQWHRAAKHNKAQCRRCIKSVDLLRRYGIDIGEYDCMMSAQRRRCACCHERFVSGGVATVPHVDHSHATLAVRGLLCHACNVALGHVKDDPRRALCAALYLLKSEHYCDAERAAFHALATRIAKNTAVADDAGDDHTATAAS